LFVKFHPEERSKTYKKLKIDKLKTYLSFITNDEGNFRSVITTDNRELHEPFTNRSQQVVEKRVTRISIKKKDIKIMGTSCISATEKRHEIMEKACRPIIS
jgi:hypothetical protein